MIPEHSVCTEIPKSIRAITFIAMVVSSRFPIPYSRFASQEYWGHPRSFRRLRNGINDQWFQATGEYLFDIVDGMGQPAFHTTESFIKRKEPRNTSA